MTTALKEVRLHIPPKSQELNFFCRSKKLKSKTRNLLIGIIMVFVVIFSAYSCVSGSYNKMIELDENVSAQWAQVENQYQRRYDLIPNLVATVKGYAKQESEVYTQVAEARSKAGGVITLDESILEDEQKMQQFQRAQDSLGGALQRLLSVTENYPELKSNENFLALQDQLEGTENRISVERKKYNEIAQNFNTTIRRFPNSLLANTFGFRQKVYFQASSEAQSAPKVEF